MCLQDVCIGIWPLDGHTDRIMKVVDICPTDASDPTHCSTPADLKIDRSIATALFSLDQDPGGDTYPEQGGWFFTKCWAEV